MPIPIRHRWNPVTCQYEAHIDLEDLDPKKEAEKDRRAQGVKYNPRGWRYN